MSMTSIRPPRVAIDASRPGTPTPAPRPLDRTDAFQPRHIGPSADEIQAMLSALGYPSLEALADAAVPETIRLEKPLDLPAPMTETEALEALRAMEQENEVRRSFIGMGYHDTVTPPVIQRNILENPGWYTSYTPYQSEISQGRLEALLNFQTVVADLTALPLANASLLDEATAAAEAMAMCYAVTARGFDDSKAFFIADTCHPQTVEVVRTRAAGAGVPVEVGPLTDFDPAARDYAGVLIQYPESDGAINNPADTIARAKEHGAMSVVACDLLSLALLTPPGELGADIAVGSSQRFGVPLGFGGPHAAFIATSDAHARRMPGRIIGVSRDAHGNPAYRMAIQTREQHIRRERATSNICTAQALLAIMAGMYAVYHGPDGIKRIARRVHDAARVLRRALRDLDIPVDHDAFFDTLRVRPADAAAHKRILDAADAHRINLRPFDDGSLGVALDERVTREELDTLIDVFAAGAEKDADTTAEQLENDLASGGLALPPDLQRTTDFLTHEVFNTHHSETELLRYIFKLQERDISLAHAMIPLGSCTMKLNATSEMLPVTWPGFASLHPYAPREQWRGYDALFNSLSAWIRAITGYDAVSLQPNAGSQGEYTGLMVIRAYHHANNQRNRDVCLIPTSAHGTNPASAVVAGFRVVPVKCDESGDVDLADLRERCAEHAENLGALMLTYPSTHGVFEQHVRDVCAVVHEHGGQVYMDGANLNAQVGLCNPAEIGADVCHLNLHKTFCIPHGGGGPGMGPIGVKNHLAPFLPGHPINAPESTHDHAIGPVAAAPFGSPSILTISWMYIAMMGAPGLTDASRVAILSANYMANRLHEHYDVLFRGRDGLVAHEFIIDLRPFDKSCGIKADDVAKRLMDFGFHAPTMSWPVPGTLMIEPTESESQAELDRFCDAMITIREEIRAIEQGHADPENNPLKHAPHTAGAVTNDDWPHPYPRQQAAYPLPWVRERKFWPPVARVDNPFGDRHLVCTCPSVEEVASG